MAFACFHIHVAGLFNDFASLLDVERSSERQRQVQNKGGRNNNNKNNNTNTTTTTTTTTNNNNHNNNTTNNNNNNTTITTTTNNNNNNKNFYIYLFFVFFRCATKPPKRALRASPWDRRAAARLEKYTWFDGSSAMALVYLATAPSWSFWAKSRFPSSFRASARVVVVVVVVVVAVVVGVVGLVGKFLLLHGAGGALSVAALA